MERADDRKSPDREKIYCGYWNKIIGEKKIHLISLL